MRYPMQAMHRKNFEEMTPIFPNERMSLECGKTVLQCVLWI